MPVHVAFDPYEIAEGDRLTVATPGLNVLWNEFHKARNAYNRKRQQFFPAIPLPNRLVHALRLCKETPSGGQRKIITTNAHKTLAGEASGIKTGLVYLAPATSAHIKVRGLRFTLCPNARACIKPCIQNTGQMVYSNAKIARLARTLWFLLAPDDFLATLWTELVALRRAAERAGMQVGIRLDGTSDLLWGDILTHAFGEAVVDEFMQLGAFYGYTKLGPAERAGCLKRGFHFTYSWNETPDSPALSREWLRYGVSTALVIAGPRGTTPEENKEWSKRFSARYAPGKEKFYGRHVLDYDVDDARFRDSTTPHWGALSFKGHKATQDGSGFALRFDDNLELIDTKQHRRLLAASL